MENKDLLNKLLKSSEVSKSVHFQSLDITIALSSKGCKGCIFDTPEKANGCNFKNSCMAHLRNDRQSVVFTYAEIK